MSSPLYIQNRMKRQKRYFHLQSQSKVKRLPKMSWKRKSRLNKKESRHYWQSLKQKEISFQQKNQNNSLFRNQSSKQRNRKLKIRYTVLLAKSRLRLSSFISDLSYSYATFIQVRYFTIHTIRLIKANIRVSRINKPPLLE